MRPNVKVYPKDLVPGKIYTGYESKHEDRTAPYRIFAESK